MIAWLAHDRDGVIELRVARWRWVVAQGQLRLMRVSIGESSPVVHDGVGRVPWDILVVVHVRASS